VLSGVVPAAHIRAAPAPYGAWVRACVLAELVGMTAAAAAAVSAMALADRTGTLGSPAVGLLVVVLGGLVEGTALGWLQSRVLGAWRPDLRRGRYLLATVAVAGLGWAVASAPSVLSGDDGGTTPPLLLMAALAVGLGLVMGAVLGAAQAWALRGAVRHPWRWVAASVWSWPLPMVVIFAGASLPDDGWPTWQVLLMGPVTGLVAGLLLGVLSGWFLPSLDGLSASGRMVLAVLGGPFSRTLDRRVLGLAVTGLRTGQVYRLPVQFALGPDGLVVVPGGAPGKTWWRNVGSDTGVRVLLERAWHDAHAAVLEPHDSPYGRARAAYLRCFPGAHLPLDQPIVLVTLPADDVVLPTD
jgi:F420H(2)-dependent quinone reductase